MLLVKSRGIESNVLKKVKDVVNFVWKGCNIKVNEDFSPQVLVECGAVNTNVD
jgi:hypothetical protein